MQLPVTIPLRPSRRLALLLAAAHLAALAVVWPLSLSVPTKGLLAAAIVASGLYFLRRQRHPAIAALHLAKGGEMEIEPAGGVREPVAVMPQAAVVPGLIVLLLQRHGRSRIRALVLPSDSMGSRAHRQLRLWLKWHAAAA